MASAPVVVGQRFSFHVGPALGRGGMGDVFLGTRHDDLSEIVAIKVPLSNLPPDVRDLFLREAEAARQVDHANVVKVVDWGKAPPFIALEFAEGGTLATEVARRQPGQHWTEPELITLFRQLVG